MNEDIIKKVKGNLDKLNTLLNSDEVLKLKGPEIQMLIEQRYLMGIIIESLEKEVSEKND